MRPAISHCGIGSESADGEQVQTRQHMDHLSRNNLKLYPFENNAHFFSASCVARFGIGFMTQLTFPQSRRQI